MISIEEEGQVVEKPTVKKLCVSSYVYPPDIYIGILLGRSLVVTQLRSRVLRKRASNIQAI